MHPCPNDTAAGLVLTRNEPQVGTVLRARAPLPKGKPAATLANENIVCFAHEPWHGPWKTYQQIMSILAETNRVFYVGPPDPLRQAARGFLSRRVRRPVVERATPTLLVYHAPRLMARANTRRVGARQWNWLNDRLRSAHVRHLAQRNGFSSPILWIFDPMMAPTVGTFGEKLVIYHVLDNYAEFIAPQAAALRAAMALNDERMLQSADIVVAVSARLHERCLRRNPNSFLVPNGVNDERFRMAAASGVRPADLLAIPRPIVGYIGAVQPIVDFALLRQLSIEHSEWSIVLVGPQELGEPDLPAFRTLVSRPNVFYLGCKPVEDVPAYVSACDVCIMPYHREKSTVPDSDSIKLYEYLACGRPVVSVDVPSVRRFLPLVRIANDARGFTQCIEESLGDGPELCAARQAAAAEHSWSRRVGVLSELVSACLAEEASTAREGAAADRAEQQ
jgi:glycosyltransferase involved in cell wall biosynthesis